MQCILDHCYSRILPQTFWHTKFLFSGEMSDAGLFIIVMDSSCNPGLDAQDDADLVFLAGFDGAICLSSMALGLKGYIPVFLNPLNIFMGVKEI